MVLGWTDQSEIFWSKKIKKSLNKHFTNCLDQYEMEELYID